MGIAEKLEGISSHLGSLSKNSETAAYNELSFATEDLLVYLNSHVYASTPFGGFGHGLDETAKTDIVHLVKTEIRNVKGAVLNM